MHIAAGLQQWRGILVASVQVRSGSSETHLEENAVRTDTRTYPASSSPLFACRLGCCPVDLCRSPELSASVPLGWHRTLCPHTVLIWFLKLSASGGIRVSSWNETHHADLTRPSSRTPCVRCDFHEPLLLLWTTFFRTDRTPGSLSRKNLSMSSTVAVIGTSHLAALLLLPKARRALLCLANLNTSLQLSRRHVIPFRHSVRAG